MSSIADYDDIVAIAPESHEVIFENETIRVLKVTVPANGTVPMHSNPENVNYILKAGILRLIDRSGSAVDVELSEGQVIPAPQGSHAVENIGETEIQTVCIELKK